MAGHAQDLTNYQQIINIQVAVTDQLHADDSRSDHNHRLWDLIQGQSSCRGHHGVLIDLKEQKIQMKTKGQGCTSIRPTM